MDMANFSPVKLFAKAICLITLTSFAVVSHAEYYLVYPAGSAVVCCPNFKKPGHKHKKYKKVSHKKSYKKKCVSHYKKFRRSSYSSVTVYYPRCVRSACDRRPRCGSGCGTRDYVTFINEPTSYYGTFIPYEYYDSYDMRTADDNVYVYPDMNWGY